MTETPPPDPPSNPPVVAQLPVEPVLPDTDEAKHLYLSAEAVRQRAKALSEEVTQEMDRLGVQVPTDKDES